MVRPGTITPKILDEWGEEISGIADALGDPGRWSEQEWGIVYKEIVVPLRNAVIGLGDLITFLEQGI